MMTEDYYKSHMLLLLSVVFGIGSFLLFLQTISTHYLIWR